MEEIERCQCLMDSLEHKAGQCQKTTNRLGPLLPFAFGERQMLLCDNCELEEFQPLFSNIKQEVS